MNILILPIAFTNCDRLFPQTTLVHKSAIAFPEAHLRYYLRRLLTAIIYAR
jgi:hypothetical protein